MVSTRLILGDCLEVMPKLEAGSVDAIIADIPYGTTACKWDTVIPFAPMWEQLNRIIKKNGAIVLFGSEPFSSALRMSNIKNYRYDWIWKKTMATLFQHANRMPMKIHENISVFYSKSPTYNPQKTKRDTPYTNKTGDRGISGFHNNPIPYKPNINIEDSFPVGVIEFSNGNRNRLHPTQKPAALMEYLIRTYTNEGETVLDFTMGSGTTMVACINTDRSGIGIERDPDYFAIAEKRIAAAQPALFA